MSDHPVMPMLPVNISLKARFFLMNWNPFFARWSVCAPCCRMVCDARLKYSGAKRRMVVTKQDRMPSMIKRKSIPVCGTRRLASAGPMTNPAYLKNVVWA